RPDRADERDRGREHDGADRDAEVRPEVALPQEDAAQAEHREREHHARLEPGPFPQEVPAPPAETPGHRGQERDDEAYSNGRGAKGGPPFAPLSLVARQSSQLRMPSEMAVNGAENEKPESRFRSCSTMTSFRACHGIGTSVGVAGACRPCPNCPTARAQGSRRRGV